MSSLLIWLLFFSMSLFNSPSHCLPFSPSNNVTLLGDAHFKNNTLILTQELTCLNSPPSSSSSNPKKILSLGVGRALYLYPIRFLDSGTNTTASFSCQFSFSINPVSPLCPETGEGLAFLITSNAGAFSRSNGYMGLPDSSLHPQDSFVAVEFDTSFEPELGDINGNHIGIDVNTVVSFASVDAVSKGIDLRDGKELNAWIEYRDSVQMIRVWVGYSQIRPASPVIVSQIDLSKQFKEFMHVGFSAGNGKGSAIHMVRNWQFKTFGSLPVPSSMDTVEEGDCFMCSPDDLDSNNTSITKIVNKKSRIEVICFGLGGLASFAIILFSVLALASVFIQRKRNSFRRKYEDNQVHCRGGLSKLALSRLKSATSEFNHDSQISQVSTTRVGPTRLILSEIKSATSGFNQSKIIGEGASAVVYEGHIPSCGGQVAVKRFSKINHSFSHPFTTEFATMVSCLCHKNLVQLQGWCCEGNELILVYEYLPNGSLDKLLHKDDRLAKMLTFEIRINIVYGIASALTYLHEECERQVIHRDVKSCNIMIDENFNAKLGDFGLAEMYERSSITREATIPAGTMGYLAPEYVYSGVPTEKTDVYSFGVVVLELATGRRPVEDDGIVTVDWVWEFWEKGRLIEAVDSRLMGKFRRWEMERMIMVGLCCAHPNFKKRLSVKEAAEVLRGDLPLPVLPVKRPVVRISSILPGDCVEEMPEDLDEAAWSTPRSHFN